MSSVTERIDGVINATATLRDIRTKLAEIDEERRILEEQAQRILESLSMVATLSLDADHPKTRPISLVNFGAGEDNRVSLTDRIIGHLASNPGTDYGATDLAAALGLTGESAANTVRGTLSRLASEERITKSGYGKYRAKMEVKENAPPAGNE